MSENSSESNEPEEQGAERAGTPEEQDAGGYGGPGTDEEIAPGFEVENDGGS